METGENTAATTLEHRCEICNCIIPEEWLRGDYSALHCDKEECVEAYDKKLRAEFESNYL